MENYFLLKYKEKVEGDRGIKWVSHQVLVYDTGITEVEAKFVKHQAEFPNIEYEIESITKSRIEEVIE